jgi:hypothetical protein
MRFYVSLGTREEDLLEWITDGVNRANNAPKWLVKQQAEALRGFMRELSPWLH